jgi:chemotaxis protein CheZ
MVCVKAGEFMGEQRKVFRIERMAAAHLEEDAGTAPAPMGYAEIMHELRALRGAIAAVVPSGGRATAAPERGEVARLTCQLHLIADAIAGEDPAGTETNDSNGGSEGAPLSRIECELNAIVNGTEKATQKILAAAEAIDSTANTLSAALDGRIEQELAQDIQDFVIQIFEACNFQDLIGQRVAKVLAALKFVEDHIARILNEIKTASASARQNGGQALHGPQLESDSGHASQSDIDAMFANGCVANNER